MKQNGVKAKPEEALAEYKRTINYLLKEADTTTTDTLINFLDFKINIPKGTVYDNSLNEPMILHSDSANDLLITFRVETNKEKVLLEEYSESTIEMLEGNSFSAGYKIENKKIIAHNKAIQYDYSKTRKGANILIGQIFFVINNNRLFRITISKLGVSKKQFTQETINLKEGIKKNVLQQGLLCKTFS